MSFKLNNCTFDNSSRFFTALNFVLLLICFNQNPVYGRCMSAPITPTQSPIPAPQPNTIVANLLCFSAMFFWAIGFPAAEVLLETWGAVTIMVTRLTLSTILLLALWVYQEGWHTVKNSQWLVPMKVGAIGFGVGSLLFLIGQKYSDAVIPAIIAAMMPIFGGILEVVLEGRKLRPRLIIGIILALVGGYLATGVKLSEGTFGLGALLCLLAIPLYAWSTRSITREFPKLSPLGQTTTTIVGAWVLVCVAFIGCLLFGIEGTAIGTMDTYNIVMLLIFSIAAFTLSQTLWIKAAGSLGILFASLHMNAVPFYVMIVMVLMFDATWSWLQALGALIVGIGVIYSQMKAK